MELTLLGFLFILMPVILAHNAGVKTDEDMTTWLTSLDLNKILLLQFLIKSGVGFIVVGLAISLI